MHENDELRAVSRSRETHDFETAANVSGHVSFEAFTKLPFPSPVRSRDAVRSMERVEMEPGSRLGFERTVRASA